MKTFNLKSAAAVAGLALVLVPSAAMADMIIYNSIPSPLPGNVPSWAYQATQTSEFGDEIQFAGTARNLTTVTVTLSDWAKQSDYPGFGTASGFTVPMTLNIYNTGTGNSVGSLIASNTTVQNIQWHPDPDPSGFNGLAQTVSFDFGGTVVLPNQVIYGLVFNTETWGPNPTGVNGPYDSLNFGFNDSGTAPSVGAEVIPGSLYLNSATPSNYLPTVYDPAATPFQLSAGWAPYVPAVKFAATSVPEPSSLALLATALLGLGVFAARRRGKTSAAI